MKKVLIAEDEPALLDSYEEAITGLGYECIAARDGREAVDLARRHHPDVVITDYMMPMMSGIDVIRALRRDPVLARVPTILVTAGRVPQQERSEAAMFVPKPLTLDRLEAVIRDAVALAAKSASNGNAFSAAAPADAEPISVLREQMLSWVSHEIRSPLSAAVMAAELMKRGIKTGEPSDVLEDRVVRILRQLKRMDELATTILDAAQLQDGKLRLDVETFDVSAYVRGLVLAWRDLYPDYTFEIVDGAHAEVDADRERIRQILDNLISNAIKYGGPSKVVGVGISVSASDVVISVRDQGHGIPAAELPHIFDRFHRVAGQGGRGHGLGLYISAALARLHGGTIIVESEVGRGSTFALVIPRR